MSPRPSGHRCVFDSFFAFCNVRPPKRWVGDLVQISPPAASISPFSFFGKAPWLGAGSGACSVTALSQQLSVYAVRQRLSGCLWAVPVLRAVGRSLQKVMIAATIPCYRYQHLSVARLHVLIHPEVPSAHELLQAYIHTCLLYTSLAYAYQQCVSA